MQIPKNKMIDYLMKRCKKSGISVPDSTIVLSGNNEIIKAIADSFDAWMINKDPVYAEYICSIGECNDVVFKSIRIGLLKDDRMVVSILDPNTHNYSRLNLHDIIGGDCYEW